jgi:hypothetical protein
MVKSASAHKKRANRFTRKIYPPLSKLSGSIISRKEGWIIMEVHGEPFSRGFAHGVLLYDEMQKIMKTFPYIVKTDFKVSFDSYLSTCRDIIYPVVMKKYPEFYQEIRGMSMGFASKGLSITPSYLIAWNALLSMYSYYKNNSTYRCSAFIATGDATSDGKIVMAHNTHTSFIVGQTQNVIIYVSPEKGIPFVMQSAPGFIASGTDWFICSSGIMGCETTISGINYLPKFGEPYFCRIRQAMQYGKTLDEYVNIMLDNNAGDYACSWLLGDIHTNEIMLFEIGKKKHATQRTKNGLYYGMNSAMDFELRSTETNDKSFFNLETSSGARNFRLNQLLHETYYGKLDTRIAKTIMADHYDVFLHKKKMSSRTICKHSELDRGNQPFGCTDGKVVDANMAKNLKFEGRFGSCCGREFMVKKHIKKYPKFNTMSDILEDLPRHAWTMIQK